jgi:hypothetical protein
MSSTRALSRSSSSKRCAATGTAPSRRRRRSRSSSPSPARCGKAGSRARSSGHSKDELAFHDALETSDSATKVPGEPTLQAHPTQTRLSAGQAGEGDVAGARAGGGSAGGLGGREHDRWRSAPGSSEGCRRRATFGTSPACSRSPGTATIQQGRSPQVGRSRAGDPQRRAHRRGEQSPDPQAGDPRFETTRRGGNGAFRATLTSPRGCGRL